jgi:primosomal protein N'
MKIAEVIINTQVKSLDKVYHYLADESLNLLEGVRVEVPFGYGNRKMIGYFTGFVEKSGFKNLKEIIRVIDEKPLISKYGFELARFIKKSCLSSMSEAFRLLLPPMVHVKVELKVKLINPDFAGKLTPMQKNALNTLKAAGGYVEMKKLMEAASVKSSVIKGLEKKEIVKLERDISNKVKEQIDKNQREYYLREQVKIIQNELGEKDGINAEVKAYKQKIAKSGMPKEAADKLYNDVDRLAKMPANMSDSALLKTYLDTVLSLPWNTRTKENFNIERICVLFFYSLYINNNKK